MKNSLSYRQIHLDFHTSEAIKNVGECFDRYEFQQALKAGHVDSVTLFSKCHHGWAYHPSKANKIHPGLQFDLLGAQLEAAHEIGVRTRVYISVGFDERAVREHPEWRFEERRHDFDNFSVPQYHLLCMNTPYLDYVLEQIKEVLVNYDFEGFFLDITGIRPCCCSSCMKSMLENGLNPDNPADIWQFGEKTYKEYIRRVRETIDSIKPDCSVFHNCAHIKQGKRELAYANSHFELESLPTGGWGYDHFPVSARYVWNLGLEYLGMTGKFHTEWGEFGGFKHPNALRYEAALSAAHGAKCSIGDQLAPSGKMDMTTYELIGEAYGELERKEEWLNNSIPVCDVAVLSVEAVENTKKSNSAEAVNFYKPTLQSSDIGAGRIFLEGKYMFSVIDCESDFGDYKVIILPDKIEVDSALSAKLKRYVLNGGKILASGSSAICDNKFMFDFGAEYLGVGEFVPSYTRPVFDNKNDSDYIMYTPYKKIKSINGTALAQVIKPYFNRTAEHFCSHLHTPSSGEAGGDGVTMGKDGAYIAWEIFSDYAQNGELIARKTVCCLLDMLLDGQKSMVTSLGSMGVASLMKQSEKKRYVAHLLYAIPTPRGNGINIIEDINPVFNISLSIKVPENISSVYLAPEKKEIPFTVENGFVKVNIEKIDCHQMVVFQWI